MMDNEQFAAYAQEVSDELYLDMRERLLDWLVTTYNENVPEWTLERYIGAVQDTLGTVAVIEFLERIGAGDE
jgi:hypothetical protein